MADRNPIVLIDGVLRELPEGDTLPIPGAISIYQYRVEANDTPASIAGGSWVDVPLNAEVIEGIAGASLSSPVVTLPAGSYLFEHWGQTIALNTVGAPNVTIVRLWNNTAGAEISGSSGAYARAGEAGSATFVDVHLVSRGAVVVTLGASTDIKLQLFAFASAFGDTTSLASQVCAQLKIMEL